MATIPTNDSRGFTLVEIAVAISVMGILALAMVGTMATNSRASTFVAEEAQARDAVRSQLEDILAWPTYSTVIPEFHGDTFPVDTLTGVGGNPPGSVTVTEPQPNLLSITVRVDWVGPSGNETCEIRTMRTNRDL